MVKVAASFAFPLIFCQFNPSAMEITFKPIAFVRSSRTKPTDDFWGNTTSVIELADHVSTEALNNVSGFSHLEIIYHFDRAKIDEVVFSGRPRGNPAYPAVGVFAQRKKDRPSGFQI